MEAGDVDAAVEAGGRAEELAVRPLELGLQGRRAEDGGRRRGACRAAAGRRSASGGGRAEERARRAPGRETGGRRS